MYWNYSNNYKIDQLMTHFPQKLGSFRPQKVGRTICADKIRNSTVGGGGGQPYTIHTHTHMYKAPIATKK